MPANLIAAGATAANSADIVLAAGAAANVCLKAPAAGAFVRVYLKDDEGNYQPLVQRVEIGIPLLLSGPGTYRLSREAGVSCGVFNA